jgi:hypothetical protein
VGFFWALVKMADQGAAPLTDPLAMGKMGADLISTVIRAICGDEESRKALLEMLPFYGTYRNFADAYDAWEAKRYFDSGGKIFSGTLGAAGDVTLLSGACLKTCRLLRKANLKVVEVAEWKTPVERPSNRQIDLAAMDEGKAFLERRGYRDIISLTNPSGHGIDYIARKTLANGSDVWVHIEVKGHWFDGPPVLRGDQAKRNDFVRSRLETIAENLNRRWDPAKIDSKIIDAAQEALDEIRAGRRIHGITVNVDQATGVFPGPRTSVWYWPREGGEPFQIGF